MTCAVMQTAIPGLPPPVRGKVRDVYDLGDMLLLVATDRLSAFDVVLPDGIPDKGRVLTQVSCHWFRVLRPLAVNHMVTCDDGFIAWRIAEAGGGVDAALRRDLAGRCTLGVKARPFPVECVVRGCLAGSLWKEYRAAGGERGGVTLHGIDLPGGLRESDRLPAPVFTPATKAKSGHDENIGMSEMEAALGRETASQLRAASVALYEAAAARAARSGLLLADTKFEFGLHRGVLTLIDEALTPDSSRYWEASEYAPGGPQPSYDKQFVRDWLEGSGWNKEPPAPRLPDDVAAKTAEKYREALLRLTGRALEG